jgi:hypothetical protein
MMYVGRPKNHSGDTYRFMNLATRKIVHSRDAVWMNRVYGEWKGFSKPVMPEMVTKLIQVVKADEIPKGTNQVAQAAPQPAPMAQPLVQVAVQPNATGQQGPPTQSAPEKRVTRSASRLPSTKALGELKRLGSDLMNPEAKTLVERIKESNARETGRADPQAPVQERMDRVYFADATCERPEDYEPSN